MENGCETTKKTGVDFEKFVATVRDQLADSADVKRLLLESDDQVRVIAKIAGLIVDSYLGGGKVILFGNGGSAADAQHLACELVSKFEIERSALPAIALNVNTSILTAVGNDYDFDQVFSRQIEAWAKPADVVVGISTSGNSPNVIEAMKAAREVGAKTVAFTGRTGGKLRELVDICLRVPSDSTPRIQETHIAVGHVICSLIESALFKKGSNG